MARATAGPVTATRDSESESVRAESRRRDSDFDGEVNGWLQDSNVREIIKYCKYLLNVDEYLPDLIDTEHPVIRYDHGSCLSAFPRME